MLSIYDDEFIEIKPSDLNKTIEVFLKKNIFKKDKFIKISEQIIRETYHNKSIVILFTLDKIDFYPDIKYIQKNFIPMVQMAGVKKLVLIVGYDEKVKVFHEELTNSIKKIKENLGIDIKLFAEKENAKDWICKQVC